VARELANIRGIVIDRLRGYYRTFVEDLRYQGLPVVLSKIVTKLVLPVAKLEFHILYVCDLTEPIGEQRARVDTEYRIELATEADLVSVLELQMGPPPAPAQGELSDVEEYQRAQFERQRSEAYGNLLMAMRAGEICFLFRIGDEVVHCNWMRFASSAFVPQRPVELEPDEVYMTDGYTAEHWRGRGVHVAVNAFMLRYAQSRGMTRAWTITDSTKAISRRGLRRVGGWQRSGQLLYITPRKLGRTWLVRLGGNVDPMFRRARREGEGSGAE
jgi:hypothetical protein